eukprot:2276415-Rhodomonas_salina.1
MAFRSQETGIACPQAGRKRDPFAGFTTTTTQASHTTWRPRASDKLILAKKGLVLSNENTFPACPQAKQLGGAKYLEVLNELAANERDLSVVVHHDADPVVRQMAALERDVALKRGVDADLELREVRVARHKPRASPREEPVPAPPSFRRQPRQSI